jgi:dihydroorotase
MGASTGHMLVDDLDALDDIFNHSPLIVVTHCEDQKTVERNEQLFHDKYGDGVSPEHHHLIRDVESCYLSSSLAVNLAKKYDADLHVFHLTTEKEMELFSVGEADQKKITAEVCVHHMFFNDSYYPELGNQIKCNPSIKQESDRQALIKALLENKIDIIATDHAPHTWEEKSRAYTEAPAGLPLVQHGLQILMDFYHQDILTLETIVEKTSHNIAKRFQVKDRGYIREGYFADLAILDHDKPYEVSKENILYKCGWSPFEGHSFQSSIFMTIINGNVAFKDGKVNEDLPFGMQIEFNR